MSRHGLFFAAILLGCSHSLHADIYRWDNREVIPGTEGIVPGSGVDLSGWNSAERNLNYADFSGGLSLSQARLSESWLQFASFDQAGLVSADLHRADLTGARLTAVMLLGTDLTDANLFQANLTWAYSIGADFTRANLSEANLERASLQSNLTNADLTKANLMGAFLAGDPIMQPAILINADFTDAVVAGANFGLSGQTWTRGLTKEQLRSTASYKAKTLTGIGLSGLDLAGEDFSGFDLSGADLGLEANFAGADFTRANLTGTRFAGRSYLPTMWGSRPVPD